MTPYMRMQVALNRVTKWRAVFAGWQLGTRPKGDPESDAVRDHRELSIIMRAELTALAALLAEKRVISVDEYASAVADEAEELDRAFAARFRGITATDDGIVVTPEAAETMKGWRP